MTRSIEWKVGGQQGEGVDSTGDIFAKVLFRTGYYVTTYKQFMSRIKGGHSSYKIRATREPNQYAGEQVDILLCLDHETLTISEFELTDNAVVIVDGELQVNSAGSYLLASFPMKKLAAELGNPLAKNMIALGVSGCLTGLPQTQFHQLIEDVFACKGAPIIRTNQAAVSTGYQLASSHLSASIRPLEPAEKQDRLFLSGNEATAFGSLMAGCRFLSAYPITPASEIMEWMSTQLPAVGGTVLQVEDEIAGITFAIGASYAGARAMTSTSGPGLSLKTEALGLAGISETPIVIVNSQRSGPSTGLPTKHEQSDLQHMLHAAHGEIPRIVLYPSSIEDAFYLAADSFNLAEHYQCPVILALDLALSMNKTTIPLLDAERIPISRGKLLSADEVKALQENIFNRYRFTDDGISPRALPGMEGGIHTANSNEHSENGYCSEDPAIRCKMMEKRLEKIKTASIRQPYRLTNAESDTILVGMGSTRGIIEEVAARFSKEGIELGHLHLQQLHPLPVSALTHCLAGKKVITIENNYEGQLLSWLKQHVAIHVNAHKITQYDGNPFVPTRVYQAIKELI